MKDTISLYRISMVKEGEIESPLGSTLRTPDESARVLMKYFEGLDREVFVVVLCNIRHKIVGINVVSVGCLSSSLVHPREVFKPAILGSAAAVILAHNHPSGDPEPSAEDLSLTRRLCAAGELLGIKVVDHLVIGDGRYVSLKLRGVMW